MRYVLCATLTLIAVGVLTVPRADAASSGGSWTLTGSMHAARAVPMAVTLPSGKVLVAGGIDGNNHEIRSAELYDPSTGKWTPTGSMKFARSNGTLTLLANGTALAAGGFTFPQQPSGQTAEIYNPNTGKWRVTGQMTAFRVEHSATLLSNGKVLVAGGETSDQTMSVSTAELYDPTSGKWSATASMSTPRSLHAASLLATGQVLVSGGDHDVFFGAQGSAELYNPGSGKWSPVGRMTTSRSAQTSTLLGDGTVLVAGGRYGDNLAGAGGNPMSMTERFDPTTGEWSPLAEMRVLKRAEPTIAGRSEHTATLLQDGRVLVTGGDGNLSASNFTVFRTAEVFDPAADTWTLTPDMHVGRAQHAAVLLNDGRALVIGGSTISGLTASAEIFTPGSRALLSRNTVLRRPMSSIAFVRPRYAPSRFSAHRRTGTGKWMLTGSMHVARAGANGFPAVVLQDGRVLVEGCDDYLGRGGVTAELWNPKTGKWSFTGSMHVARCNHGAVLLPDGRVLVAGGDAGGGWTPTAEIYDPSTGKWSMAAHMHSTRTLFTLLTLANGAPFAPAGAAFGTIPRDSDDVYDPSTNTWTASSSLNISRDECGSAVLADGKVVVLGGFTQDTLWTPTSELYDSVANVWKMQGAPFGQADQAIGLPSGDALATIPSQVYNEAAGTWTLTKTNMNIPRIEDTMSLLTSGLVLAAGGCTSCGSGGGNVGQSELYDPTTQVWSLDASLNQPRSDQAAAFLHDGRVLVTGGLIGFTQIASAEVYTPAR